MPFFGSHAGAAGQAAGPVDRNLWSIDFPGANADNLTNGNLPPSTNFTVFAWINPDTVDTSRRAICAWTANASNEGMIFRMSFLSAGTLAIGNPSQGPNPESTTGPMVAGAWASVAVSVGADLNTGNVLFYHDGGVLTTGGGAATPAPVTDASGFSIGMGASPQAAPLNTLPMTGLDATLAVYASVLSGADITALHNAGAGATLFGAGSPIVAQPVRHWIMEEGTGTVTADEVSSPANDMTLNGAVSWSSNVP